jgi:hypothetical protein
MNTSTRDQDNDPGQSSAQFGKDNNMKASQWLTWQRGVTLSLGSLIALTCLAPTPAAAQIPASSAQVGSHHKQFPADDARNDVPTTLTAMQKQSLMRANFEKSKSDATELAALAKGLREVLEKPNASVLSPEVINRADKIEKLARKIREETKGI